ncbi:hypothetical protein PILCRDRAFT_830005 [Piloderma croceum F 1598]|uniref:Uncharacterized protein n=1 Tax=Piloderma croceum (strain F 1598) TaxID=765440 RepID=A0A0C3EHC4_PILCF|nr:hypothetical protein PILCRDRAFT_830005 [Piloderma croceum F 1598]
MPGFSNQQCALGNVVSLTSVMNIKRSYNARLHLNPEVNPLLQQYLLIERKLSIEPSFSINNRCFLTKMKMTAHQSLLPISACSISVESPGTL